MRTALTRTSKRPRKPLSVADESSQAKKRRARKINRTLAEAYPQARCELDFQSPFQLIVATVLSAQCTDAQVNKVTPALFRAYPDAEDLAHARQEDVEQLIHSTGFYRNKAKNIIGLGQALEENFGGEVPDTLDELVTLPGVGRKTANVVLGNAFDTPGLTVDTHFGRLSRRLGLTTQEDPVKVESDIAQLIEPSEWTDFSHRLIFHGRRVCHARTAACGACLLAGLCPSFGQYGPADPESAERLIKSPDKEHLLAMAGLIPDDAGDSQDSEVDTGASHGK